MIPQEERARPNNARIKVVADGATKCPTTPPPHTHTHTRESIRETDVGSSFSEGGKYPTHTPAPYTQKIINKEKKKKWKRSASQSEGEKVVLDEEEVYVLKI